MDPAATPRPDPAAERAARMNSGLQLLMVPVVLALGFLLASFAVRNSDYWMRLATGRLIANGEFSFGNDPFSFGTENRIWVHHSWLFDLLLYQLHGLGDPSVVVYVKAALVALMALVLLLACRRAPDETIIPGTKADPGGWVAAIAVGLALIASAPRMTMESTIISLLFFAVTLWVLLRSRYWPATVMPIALCVLFALWVNLDSWFLIGPVLVAVFLVGELIQGFIPGLEKVPAARLKLLALTLVIGVAACLLNPHHVRAFTVLPTELDPNIVPAMRNDPGWRLRFVSTTSILYRTRPDLGTSVPGLCYAALLLLGAGSFALNFKRLRLPLLLAWLLTAGLTAFVSWRLIPFFALVGAAALALNVHSFFARRPYRRGVKWESPAPATGRSPEEGGGSEGWWPGATESAAAPPNPPPTSSPAAGEMTVTPETVLALLGVMGRLLTVVAGLGLLALTYPGWLHAGARTFERPRRLGWEVEPDPALVELAEHLHRLQRDGRLPADARGLALHLDVPNYCAWHAPGVRFLLDLRFSLLGDRSADYMKAKQGLNEYGIGTESPGDFASVLRRHDIMFVIPSRTNEAGGFQLIGRMLVDEDQWALWFQNGECAVFGWHDPEGPPATDPLRLDLVSLAFGANAVRLPPGDAFGVQRFPPPPSLAERDLVEKFLSPPAPPPPPASLAAGLYLRMREQALANAYLRSQMALEFGLRAGQVATSNQPAGAAVVAPMIFRPLPNRYAEALLNITAGGHPVPAAISVLSVREARRGVLAHPNEGYPHLLLGLAYNSLPPAGSATLQRAEQMVALRQAVARLTPEQADGPTAGPLVTFAWLLLHDLHIARGEKDLAEEALGQTLARYLRHPPADIPESQLGERLEQLRRGHEKLRNDVLTARDSFVVEKAELSQRNSPPAELAARALRRYGLVREAIRSLEEVSDRLDIPASQQLADLYLATGQAEEALRVLDLMPPQVQDQMALLRIHVLVSLGEYARAGQMLEARIAAGERDQDPRQPFVAAALIAQSLHFSSVEMAAQASRLATVPWVLDDAANESGMPRNPLSVPYLTLSLELIKSQKAGMLAARAMLALQEGDIPAARNYFRKAIDLDVFFEGIANARNYLRVLEQQAK